MPIQFNKVTWYSKLGAVILFLVVVPILSFVIGKQYAETYPYASIGKAPAYTIKQVKDVDLKQNPLSFLDGSYYIDNERITLVNGKAEMEPEFGGASKTEVNIFGQPVMGDLNGDGREDAIFLVSQETGGTGIFFYVLAAVGQGDNKYIGTNDIFLGDRIAPQDIRIINGIAEVNYAVRRDTDPMTVQPSMGTTKYLQIKGGKLIVRGPEVNGY